MGDGTIFHADVRKDGHYTCKRMVYDEMFYGGMVLFSGEMASSFNSSSEYNSLRWSRCVYRYVTRTAIIK